MAQGSHQPNVFEDTAELLTWTLVHQKGTSGQQSIRAWPSARRKVELLANSLSEASARRCGLLGQDLK